MTIRILEDSPGVAGLYAKVLATTLPGPLAPQRSTPTGGEVPDPVRLERVALDAERLAKYREICGFTGQSVPATYPHVLAFPLHLMIMTDPAFPFAPVGVVHIGNSITQLQPLSQGQALDLTIACGPAEAHRRGQQVTLLTEAECAGEVVWRSESVLLGRVGKFATAARTDEPEASAAAPAPSVPDRAPTGPQVWRLPANLGRRYAAVSGDRNPIHLYDLTAKPFGFSHHIAHGMWTKARCLAELQNGLPDAFRAVVAFRKPVTLPSSVRFGARSAGTTVDFGMSSPSTGSTYVVGRVTEE